MYTLTRVYDYQAGATPAVLADRLWPRGISKARLAQVLWAKDVTPSTALRQGCTPTRRHTTPNFANATAPNWHKPRFRQP